MVKLVFSRMFNLDRIDNLPISINNFYCVINCSNMSRVKIFRAKCLGIVTLKVLPTSCSRYNSENKSSKFLFQKVKLNRINTSVPVQVL